METLIFDLKKQIIEALNLEDVTPDDIDTNAPLFVEGLGLDSIDALELIVLMEKQYGIKLEDPGKSKEIFRSVATMADYISKNRFCTGFGCRVYTRCTVQPAERRWSVALAGNHAFPPALRRGTFQHTGIAKNGRCGSR